MATITETARLRLRELTLDDAPFVLALVNDPDWLRYIGDRDVRDLDDARRFLREGPLAMYAREGFGLWAVLARDDAGAAPLGLCGLLRRDYLDAVDVGYAFLPAARGRGLAREAAAAVLALARARFGAPRVLAIVTPDNGASIRLLESLGLRYERALVPPGGSETLHLYALASA